MHAFPSGTFKTNTRFVTHLAGRDFLHFEVPLRVKSMALAETFPSTPTTVPSGHLDDIVDSFDRDPEVLVTLYEELFGDFAATVSVKKNDRLTIGSPSETRRKDRTKDGWTSI